MKAFIRRNDGWEYVETFIGHPGISEVFKNLKVKIGNSQLTDYNPYNGNHKDRALVLYEFGKFIDLGIKTHPTYSHQGSRINPLALPIHSTAMGLQKGQVVKPNQLLRDANYTESMRQEIMDIRAAVASKEKQDVQERLRKRPNDEID